jgi:hypothetical protein
VREGRLDLERLVELLARALRELEAAKRRIAELEKQLEGLATAKAPEATAAARAVEPFSMRAEERQRARPRRARRMTSADNARQRSKALRFYLPPSPRRHLAPPTPRPAHPSPAKFPTWPAAPCA